MSTLLMGDEYHVTGYDPAHRPPVSVAPGETFMVHTRDRFAAMPGGGEPCELPGDLVGPVWVGGVEPGDVLAIEVLDIKPLTGTGYLLGSPGYGILGAAIEQRARAIPIDAMGVVLREDAVVPYRPMIGKLGVLATRARAGTETGAFGGALSATQLAPGTTLFVRCANAGGGVLVEDVHAVMGDGEATASAVEMAAEVTLRCARVDEVPAPPPALLTAEELVVFGEGENLDVAARAATDAMLAVLMTRHGVDLTDAALLAGAAMDLRISFIGQRPARVRAAVPRSLVML